MKTFLVIYNSLFYMTKSSESLWVLLWGHKWIILSWRLIRHIVLSRESSLSTISEDINNLPSFLVTSSSPIFSKLMKFPVSISLIWLMLLYSESAWGSELKPSLLPMFWNFSLCKFMKAWVLALKVSLFDNHPSIVTSFCLLYFHLRVHLGFQLMLQIVRVQLDSYMGELSDISILGWIQTLLFLWVYLGSILRL